MKFKFQLPKRKFHWPAAPPICWGVVCVCLGASRLEPSWCDRDTVYVNCYLALLGKSLQIPDLICQPLSFKPPTLEAQTGPPGSRPQTARLVLQLPSISQEELPDPALPTQTRPDPRAQPPRDWGQRPSLWRPLVDIVNNCLLSLLSPLPGP